MTAVTSDEFPDAAVFVICSSSGATNKFERSIGRLGSSSLATTSVMGAATTGGALRANTSKVKVASALFPFEVPVMHFLA